MKHLNMVDTCSYKMITGLKGSKNLDAVSHLWIFAHKNTSLRGDSCGLMKYWLTHFRFVPFFKIKFLPQKQRHFDTGREKRPEVRPGESLDRDDMTYHLRAYQISFWRIRPLWGSTAWWWERLWLKIGWCGLRNVWAGSGGGDAMTVCAGMFVDGYHSDGECLFVCDNKRITDISG